MKAKWMVWILIPLLVGSVFRIVLWRSGAGVGFFPALALGIVGVPLTIIFWRAMKSRLSRNARAVIPLLLGLIVLGLVSWTFGGLGFLEVLGLGYLLAIVAIYFATIQFLDSGKQIKRIEDIALSMTTRYIGKFPDNLPGLIDVVRAAKRELLIFADFVGYGSYSNPKEYDEFFDKLNDAACNRQVKVRFLVYDEKPARESLARQFPEVEFEKTRKSPEFECFFGRNPGIAKPKTPAELTHAEFLDVLRKDEEGFKTRLCNKGVEISYLPSQERLFFWMGDQEEAVFSFEDVRAGELLCFRTRDARLLQTFKYIFESPLAPKVETLSESGIAASAPSGSGSTDQKIAAAQAGGSSPPS